MDFDRTARKQDPLRQMRATTSTLSATIESRAQDEVINRVVDELSALHRTHGLLSDEFNGL